MELCNNYCAIIKGKFCSNRFWKQPSKITTHIIKLRLRKKVRRKHVLKVKHLSSYIILNASVWRQHLKYVNIDNSSLQSQFLLNLKTLNTEKEGTENLIDCKQKFFGGIRLMNYAVRSKFDYDVSYYAAYCLSNKNRVIGS